MPDAVAFRIADALLTRLAPLALEVELSASSEPQRFPALHLDDDGETVTSQDWQATRCQLQFTIVGYALGAGREGARVARNLDAAVVGAVMADQTLGGLATQINLGPLSIERVKLAAKPGVTFSRQMDVDFSFQSINPTAVGG